MVRPKTSKITTILSTYLGILVYYSVLNCTEYQIDEQIDIREGRKGWQADRQMGRQVDEDKDRYLNVYSPASKFFS